ncbi:PBSX family phage terminase large subunit [Lysinibacillus boronitolerans]|uniref:PBSX family phage terminase large subunit n=1 Tax=Lysinibacillus boronitolerans TaxID=309788 RepID=UPI00216345F7|nr:PBSX family phage terminase large subunit [Lysinibacillus boronitolerans]MCS1393582.1 PBSX family phage terminase large subunit [Lysinibacillus boronitolerans]
MSLAVEKEVNPHFEDFLFDWRCKTQLLVGGYGSSKSYHVALKILLKLLQEKRTALVVREVYDTHRDSTFSLFTEIIEDLGLSGKIKTSSSPMTVKFPNGSKIIFRGMDKPEKLKSINNISLIWLEECSEIKYAGFKELLGRLRHPKLDLFIILSTNPVSKGNWVYKHFFKNELEDYFVLDDEELYKLRTIIVNNTYYHHSTADDNLFLPSSYIAQLDEMELYDPDLYRIARKGRFGVNGVLVLPQFETKPHDEVMAEIANIRKPIRKNGMDFGFVDSYNALLRMVVDHENKWLYIYWEYYKRGMTDDKTADELEEEGLKKSIIKADNAEPKTIAYYKQRGFRMFACKKLTRIENTKKMKRFKRIICSDACVNTIRELKELTFKKDPKTDEIYEDEFNIDPHTFSAMWYGLDDYDVASVKGVNSK